MAVPGGSGRDVAAVLPPARCGRHSCRDRQPPLKTPPRGSSRGCLATLLTCPQVCRLARRDRASPAQPLPTGMLRGASAGVPRACGAMPTGPAGQHLHQAHVAEVAFVSAKSLVAAGVPPAALPSPPPGRRVAQPGPGRPWVLCGAVGQSPMRHHHLARGSGAAPHTHWRCSISAISQLGETEAQSNGLLRRAVSLLPGCRSKQNDCCPRDGAGAQSCL